MPRTEDSSRSMSEERLAEIHHSIRATLERHEYCLAFINDVDEVFAEVRRCWGEMQKDVYAIAMLRRENRKLKGLHDA